MNEESNSASYEDRNGICSHKETLILLNHINVRRRYSVVTNDMSPISEEHQ